jgi:hypothetical protein
MISANESDILLPTRPKEFPVKKNGNPTGYLDLNKEPRNNGSL